MATESYGVECRECGDRVIAPECSEHAADGVVRHLWRCSKCGCEFETRIVFDASSPLTPDLVEMFLPSSTSRLSPETVLQGSVKVRLRPAQGELSCRYGSERMNSWPDRPEGARRS